MKKPADKGTLEARNYVVSKSNILIQKSRFDLSVPQQKCIAYLCSLIKPEANEIEYNFNINDYFKVLGINDSGKNYLEIKETLYSLRNISYWVQKDDDIEVTVSWLSKVKIYKNSGKVRVTFDSDMLPYLMDLKEKFTSYGLYCILSMKSQYSIRIFELLKSYGGLKQKTFSVDAFKKLLGVENVKSYANNFSDFRRRVLKVAIEEINLYTDIDVSVKEEKMGNKVVKLKFIIKQKNPMDRYIAYEIGKDTLNS